MKKVLIIDDDSDIIAIIKLLFAYNKNIKVIDLNNPSSFSLDLLKDIDVVILDYMMPNLTGIDLLKIIRSKYNVNDLPVLMLTVRQDSRAKIEAMKAGANNYITKPFKPLYLRQVVENIFYS